VSADLILNGFKAVKSLKSGWGLVFKKSKTGFPSALLFL
jgi:hypothetical protein